MRGRRNRRSAQANKKENVASNADQPTTQKQPNPTDSGNKVPTDGGDKNHPPDAKNQSCKPYTEGKHWLDYLTAGFALVAAIGGVGAGIAGGYQAYVARDTEIASNRAFVIANSINFVSYTDPSNKDRWWYVAPIIENVGNTQTKSLYSYTHIRLCVPPDSATPGAYDKAMAWRGAPTEKFHPHLIGPKAEITGATVKIAPTLQMHCFIPVEGLGLIRYRDIFGYPHLLEFCASIYESYFSIDLSNYPIGQAVRLQGLPCPNHNCTDDECGPDWRERAEGLK